MTDRLNLATPTLDAVLHALIDPERTEFEIRHLDLGRARSVWLAELRREITAVRALSAPSLTRHIAADLYATDGTGRVTIPGPLYVVTDIDVDELLAARRREIAGLSAQEAHEEPSAPAPERTAWLVALGSMPPQWWTGRGDEWTTDVNGTQRNPAKCAIQFARREDAERAIGWLVKVGTRDGCRAEEHIWL